jgi:hypothetical protein
MFGNYSIVYEGDMSTVEKHNIELSRPQYFLPADFNKKKFFITYSPVNNPYIKDIQNTARNICLGKADWPNIDKIDTWMVSAETATFMKWGGLGRVASGLPENFNKTFTPLISNSLNHNKSSNFIIKVD